jgi:hypothetical protein
MYPVLGCRFRGATEEKTAQEAFCRNHVGKAGEAEEKRRRARLHACMSAALPGPYLKSFADASCRDSIV